MNNIASRSTGFKAIDRTAFAGAWSDLVAAMPIVIFARALRGAFQRRA